MEKIKRIYHRYNVNYDFMYSFNKTPSRCTILNISEGGMLLKVPQVFEKGDRLNLYFSDFPFNYSIKAKVVHTRSNFAGIAFVFDESTDYAYIQNFIMDIKDKNKIPLR